MLLLDIPANIKATCKDLIQVALENRKALREVLYVGRKGARTYLVLK